MRCYSVCIISPWKRRYPLSKQSRIPFRSTLCSFREWNEKHKTFSDDDHQANDRQRTKLMKNFDSNELHKKDTNHISKVSESFFFNLAAEVHWIQKNASDASLHSTIWYSKYVWFEVSTQEREICLNNFRPSNCSLFIDKLLWTQNWN